MEERKPSALAATRILARWRRKQWSARNKFPQLRSRSLAEKENVSPLYQPRINGFLKNSKGDIFKKTNLHTSKELKFNDKNIEVSHVAHTARSKQESFSEKANKRPCNKVSTESETKLFDIQEETRFPRSSHQRRKSRKPVRSAQKVDPDFKGVTFYLQPQGLGQLRISAFFSNVKISHWHDTRNRHTSTGSLTDAWSGSDEEGDHSPVPHRDSPCAADIIKCKMCASCGTKRTPLWRDADDGTSLCNACGIRFKKYKVRCSKCWHIPKKDIKTFPNCPCCGASLRMTVCRKTW